MAPEGDVFEPGDMAVVKTKNFSCLATMQTNGRWRETYGERNFLEVVAVIQKL
jgi:hypothetical protein